MPFQSQVNSNQAFGVPGQMYDDSPFHAGPWIISGNGNPNNIGATFYTVSAAPVLESGTAESATIWGQAIAGGTGVFAGLLVDDHVHSSQGTTAGTLVSTNAIGDGATGELADLGAYVVTLPTAAAIGDLVVYNTTTGAIGTVAAGSSSAGTGFAFAGNFKVYRFAAAGAGLAVIRA